MGKLKAFLNTNGFIYVVYINIFTILLGAVGIYITEKGITVQSIEDALWWAFVTATTVGYGDISPSTKFGRLIAGILMIMGISCISMLTGTIATYFTKKGESKNNIDINDLSETEIQKVNEFIKFIKENKSNII